MSVVCIWGEGMERLGFVVYQTCVSCAGEGGSSEPAGPDSELPARDTRPIQITI